MATPKQDGLRPDHAVTDSGSASLALVSRRPAFMAIPPLMVLAFSGAFFWVGRRRDDGGASTPLHTRESLFEEAAEANEPERFFRAARAALQQALGDAWHVPVEAVTLAAVEARLGAGATAAQVMRLADEAAYSNETLRPCDLKHWRTLVERQLKEVVS